MKRHVNTSLGMGVRALAMLALCGAALTGCKDEFTLDDAKPEWLGESVLKSLQESGQFNNYLKLVHDVGIATGTNIEEELDRTKSNTLFVAPDSAFDAFFLANKDRSENDPWRTATSYEALTESQKLLLMHCSMLNNAITMETLATSDGSVERGQYMRRKTTVSYTDSILHLSGKQLPYTYNEKDPDHEMWDALREEGVYLTDGDGTSNMMVFFTAEHMANNNMVSGDLERVLNETRKPTDVHVYDAKVEEQDVTTQNGYINVVKKVISPLPNMAEVIRTNGQTNIFSHILDRFSVPVYVTEINTGYKNVHPDFKGSIYTKWYRTSTSMTGLGTRQGAAKGGLTQSYLKYHTNEGGTIDGLEVQIGPEESDKATLNIKDEMGDAVTLKFDPAWNAIAAAGTDVFSDMAAMFVPDDETLLTAFRNGGLLYSLVDTYTPKELQSRVNDASLTNLEPLYEAIDHIPMSIIKDMINNIMKPSFVGCVESKFASVKNDAQDDLFPGGTCAVKEVKLACNGAVYITKAVYAPVDYVCVAAPAHISNDKKIMNWAIYNGSGDGTDFMKINYYAYLRAMTSRFTLFVPDDNALRYYYDTSSFKAGTKRRRLLRFTVDPKANSSSIPFKCESYSYDPSTGHVGNRITTDKFDNSTAATQQEITGRMRDILESHTIVHADESELMTGNDKDEYYLTKGGSAVKVKRDADGYVVQVQGGFQIDNERNGLSSEDENSVGIEGCTVTQKALYQVGGNGDTYVLNAPIIPSSRSVYAVLNDSNQVETFGRFMEYCESEDMEELIENMKLLIDPKTGKAYSEPLNSQLEKKYSIFREESKCPDENVAFFNNYNYTVYAPTAAALAKAESEGLPSWESILADYNQSITQDVDENGDPTGDPYFVNKDDSLRILAKMTYLFNVIRLHFQDQSVFVDRSNLENEYSTACYYTPTGKDSDGNFLKTYVKRGAGAMNIQALDIDGNPTGTPVNVVGQKDVTYNVMARDILCNKIVRGADSMNGTFIENSSSAVVHSIDGVLKIENNYPNWNDTQAVRRVLTRWQIKNKE